MFFELDSVPSGSPYENLFDLCTALVITEEGSTFPLNRVLSTVDTALQEGGEEGDVVVLATRALALMLDKFRQFLPLSGTGGAAKILKKCFGKVFSVVRGDRLNLQHERTPAKELTEELLNCLSIVSNCAELASIVPSTEQQLAFCFNSLDGSKGTSCKVLRHCIYLMRRVGLRNVGDHEVMVQLLQRHLELLCNVDIDREWDELLCAVVEGVLTYRVWCTKERPVRQKRRRMSLSSSTKTTPAPTSEIVTTTVTGDERGVSTVSFGKAFWKESSEALLAIGRRIFSLGISDVHVQLTMACVSTLVETSFCSSEAIEGAVGWVLNLLQEAGARTAGYSNPFTHTHQSGANTDLLWTDAFQPLPSSQWILPPLSCSAMVLLSKLCGAKFGFSTDYVWAWREDDDEYYPYPKDIRQELTVMYFAAEKNATLIGRRHVDLCNMTDTDPLSLNVSRIYFQPIPYTVDFDGKFVMPSSFSLIKRDTLNFIEDILRSLTFGHSQTASLARALRLYIICGGAPTRSEGVIAAFRSCVAEQTRPVVEETFDALMQRDKGWAPVLLEAGVVNVLGTFPQINESNELSVSYLRPQDSQSVVEPIQLNGSSPQVTSIKLPPLWDLPTFLCNASPAELLAFIEELERSTYPANEFKNICTEALKDFQLTLRLQAAAHTYLLRVFHQTTVAQQDELSLTDRAYGKSNIINICAKDKVVVSPIRCPNGHVLCVHFSVNWRCDLCGETNAFGSYACRECNYDICTVCSNARLSRMDVSVSAVVRDVIRAWRECLTREDLENGNTQDISSRAVLFTSRGILPAGRLSVMLDGEDVHFAEINGHCPCKVATAPFIADPMELTSNNIPLLFFLRTYLAEQQRSDIEAAVVEVLESCGAEIFERGAFGVPERLSQVLQAIAPCLSLSFKRDTVHFIAIGCYRFGLYHLKDTETTVRGIVVGDIDGTGLAARFTVKRDTKEMTQILFDAFLKYPSLKNKIEFNFEGEAGTGEGPTQELYAEISQRYRDMSILWHEKDDGTRIAFPTLRQVFYEEFFVMGACCARAFLDGYTIYLDLLPMVWPFVRFKSISAEKRWCIFMELEPAMANAYKCMLNSTDDELEEMGVVDGDEDDESCSGRQLTTATVGAYVERRVEKHLAHAAENLRCFALGLSSVVDLSAFWFLTDEEMSVVLCGALSESEETQLFNEEALRAVIVGAHGYVTGSPEVKMMISIVGGEFTREQQLFFVEFLTGSPRLPLNGLAGLGRKITVVRKELEWKGELTLPSCSTCFLYFKLPPYTSRAIMKARLLTAITEGRKNFSLS